MFLTHTRLTVKHVMLLYVRAHVCLVAREAAMWELEERHLQEKHQQLKQQLKDQYFLQRHQLLKRHEKVRVRWKSTKRTCILI